MTRLLQPPPVIEVRLDAQGAPGWITGGPLSGRLEPLGRWLVEQDWWEHPVAREYWKALLRTRSGGTRAASGSRPEESSPLAQDGLMVEVFHDLLTDSWHLERLYD